MKERFSGSSGKARVVAALSDQKILKAAGSIIGEIADVAEIIEVPEKEVIIHEDAGDDDIYFILAGKFGIYIKGHYLITRVAGEAVGELSAIEHSISRSADVVAEELSVVAKLSSQHFNEMLDKYPPIWKALAKDLAKKLHARNSSFVKPNPEPKIFVISSREAIEVADEVQSALSHCGLVTVWTNGVFFASDYPLESLETAVDNSDFAVAIALPEDTTISRDKTRKTARDNVIFELGLFMGRLGRKRTILLQPKGEELRLPSDLVGLTTLSYKTGADKDMPARIAAACVDVKKLVRELGVRKYGHGS